MSENGSYKIGAVGDRDSTLGFLALGFEVAAVTDPAEACREIDRLAQDGCAVIFVTEDVAEKCSSAIDKYKKQPLPAVVMIPGASGPKGLGLAALREAAQNAVGADILFGQEKNLKGTDSDG